MTKNFGKLARGFSRTLPNFSERVLDSFEKKSAVGAKNLIKHRQLGTGVKVALREPSQELLYQIPNQEKFLHQRQRVSVIFVRHGEVDVNRDGIWAAQSDVLLNEAGIKQSQEVGEIFRQNGTKIDKMLISPLGRVKQTAMQILSTMGQYDVDVEEIITLAELSVGKWTGKPKTEENSAFAKSWNVAPESKEEDHEFYTAGSSFNGVPFGESYEMVHKRLGSVFKYIELLIKEENKTCIVIVSHSNTGVALLSEYTGEKKKRKIDNAVPIELVFEKQGDELVFLGMKEMVLQKDEKPNTTTTPKGNNWLTEMIKSDGAVR